MSPKKSNQEQELETLRNAVANCLGEDVEFNVRPMTPEEINAYQERKKIRAEINREQENCSPISRIKRFLNSIRSLFWS